MKLTRARLTLYKASILKMLTFLLLALYIVGTSQLDILHSFVHNHEQLIIHSAGQKNGPCQQVLSHNEVEESCGHDSHLSASDSCQFFDLAIQKDQCMFCHLIFTSPDFGEMSLDNYKLSLDSYWAVLSSSRAPPNFI